MAVWKRFSKFTVVVLALGTVLVAGAWAQGPVPQGGGAQAAMTLTTTAWPDGDPIPARYTQAGAQVSPALTWANTPAGTVSFVVHMHDPDVSIQKTPDTQVHWLVWRIASSVKGLPEGVPQGAELPDGMRQISATGAVYRGPGAPATGPQHHYTIEVYALDTMIDVLPAGPATEAKPQAVVAVETRANVFKAMSGHILGKAVYVGLFRRP